MAFDPGNNNSFNKNKQRMSRLTSSSRARKILFLGLVLFAVAVVGFEIWQLRNTINEPFHAAVTDTEGSSACPEGDCGNGQQGAAEDVDTDSDGLTDREEINIYHTSPYLKDTDSDGIDDKEEIERGSDPNCPEGKDCGGQLFNPQDEGREDISKEDIESGISIPSSGTSAPATSGREILQEQEQELSAENVDRETLEQMLRGEADAETLREVLGEAGMDQEWLDGIDDDQLMQSYQQSFDDIQTDNQ